MTATLLAALGGAIIAMLLGLFGSGGSVLATPWLLYAVGIADPHVAIGKGAAAVALNAGANLALQARAGTVKWPCALSFAGAGLAGSLAGAALAQRVDGTALMGGFALAMLAVGLAMLRPPRDAGDPAVRLDAAMTVKLVPAGLVVGLAAGFFGIGGGFLIVPSLMAATGMTLANAAASSLVSVLLFGLATSATYAAAGRVDDAGRRPDRHTCRPPAGAPPGRPCPAGAPAVCRDGDCHRPLCRLAGAGNMMLARPAGLEPATPRVEATCSIQ